MKNRAIRRHHLKRMKRRAKKLAQIDAARMGVEFTNWYRKHYNHLAVCSCSMCGNPRRKMYGRDRLTKREIEAAIKMKEELENLK